MRKGSGWRRNDRAKWEGPNGKVWSEEKGGSAKGSLVILSWPGTMKKPMKICNCPCALENPRLSRFLLNVSDSSECVTAVSAILCMTSFCLRFNSLPITSAWHWKREISQELYLCSFLFISLWQEANCIQLHCTCLCGGLFLRRGE